MSYERGASPPLGAMLNAYHEPLRFELPRAVVFLAHALGGR